MIILKLKDLLVVGALASCLASAGTSSMAAGVACDGDWVDPSSNTISYDIGADNYFTGNTDCEIWQDLDQDFVNGGNDNFAAYTVNVNSFWGSSDWLAYDRDNTGGQSGSYDASGIPGTEWMAVVKDGNTTDPGTGDPLYDVGLVTYIMGTKTGTWESPFVSPPFYTGPESQTKNVSHITFYYRCTDGSQDCEDPPGGPGKVPVPAGLPLMLTAIGIGAYMRKKARKTA